MNPIAARTVIALLTSAGIGWTVFACLTGREPLATSWHVRRATEACPQIGILIMLASFCLLSDALPEVNRWVILFCVVIPLFCLGHCIWGIR